MNATTPARFDTQLTHRIGVHVFELNKNYRVLQFDLVTPETPSDGA